MSTLRKTSVLTVALALVLALLIGVVAMFGGKAANGVTGPEVNPILVAGNPSCADRGFAHGLRIESQDLDNKTYSDGILSVTISNLQYNSDSPPEAVKFDWKSSNYAVDEVLVKASNNANAFVYDPPKESMGDDGLYAPENKGISHIDFCYDLELKVEKTANTSLTRTHTWTIDKSADKDKVTLPVGGTSPVNYSVKVDQTSKDSDWQVDGTITVTAPIAATVTGVTDVISGGITDTNVNCPGTFPVDLTAGQSLNCTYSAKLPDATTRTNTATATSGTTDVKDGTGQASVDFAKATVNEIDEQIDVSDSLQGSLGTVKAADAPKTFTYKRDVGSYEQCGKYDVPNTASFTTNDTKTTDKDSWNVTATVLCKVNVEKTVSGAKPSGTQAFTFQLREGASTTQPGTTLETQVANAANGGVINFTPGLVPGSTYQLCEIVMPGWSTSLGNFVPASFYPPDGVVPDPNVDNSILCVNFTAQGQTFKVDNTPPPGGRALTIGFWKNWASCSGGKQKPVLDQTLAKAELTGEVISATSGTYPAFGPTLYLVLHGSTAKPDTAPDCQKAVKLLNKSTIDRGTKMASDPAFNLAAQLLAAELNYTASAGKTGAATNAIQQAVLLLGKYKFNGITHDKISAADATTMNNLAKILDDYNNDR